MDIWFALYAALSLVSSLALLSSPYLRITSLGWFIAVWALPYVGALFFILTVVRAKKSAHNHAICHMLDEHRGDVCQHGKVEKLGMSYEFLPYFHMNSAEILKDDAFVTSVCEAIDQATERVWITTYIFSGQVKEKVMAKLTDAHGRGVDVKLLIDRIGCGLFLASRDNPLGESVPFDVSVFHESRARSFMFMEKRLHSKIVLADDDAFIGAHNLRDEVIASHDDSVHNVSLKFSGSVVGQLEAVFVDLWKLNTGTELAASSEIHAHEEAQCHEDDRPTEHEGAPARIIFSDPIEREHNYNAYLGDLFFAATKRVYIWMPYIVPSHAMRRSIIAASKLGLDVRVLFPKVSDSPLVDNAHALVLKEFCDNGVSCALSTGDFDHSKILIIDDVVVLGSTNLDYRSLYRNYEANIEVNDADFSESIAEMFYQVFDASEKASDCDVGRVVHIKNQLTSLIAALY
ncbi:MAG: phosphatidylserine/phosphatidylglycerophosphate/cardiolipin synthase family protein [Agarilytica sp.]